MIFVLSPQCRVSQPDFQVTNRHPACFPAPSALLTADHLDQNVGHLIELVRCKPAGLGDLVRVVDLQE